MNALQKYFKRTDNTPSALAMKIGRSPSTITRVMHGQRDASISLALDVERGTKGMVKADQFMAIAIEARRRALRKKVKRRD